MNGEVLFVSFVWMDGYWRIYSELRVSIGSQKVNFQYWIMDFFYYASSTHLYFLMIATSTDPQP